jgi:hypothetical protein
VFHQIFREKDRAARAFQLRRHVAGCLTTDSRSTIGGCNRHAAAAPYATERGTTSVEQ